MKKRLCLAAGLFLFLGACAKMPSLDTVPIASALPEPMPSSLLLQMSDSEQVTYDPLRLPAYAEDFLGESLADYNAFVRAVLNGEDTVALSEPRSYPKIERTMNALLPQKALLFDARYTQGSGPLSYDESTRTVSIRYLYDALTHRTLIDAFAVEMNGALSLCTPDMSAREQAIVLYRWVTEHLHYESDMRLSVYDAVTIGAAFCQTYSMLYQLLLTQVGIACHQVGGSVDFDLDGHVDGEHQWVRLWLDGDWCYADPTWDTGDLYYFGMSREICLQRGYLEPFTDPCDALKNCRFVKHVGQ